MKKFRVRIKQAHDATGLSVYAVTKETGLSYNTVKKYVLPEQVIADYLPTEVLKLVEYYGLDWRNPAVLELVEVDPDEPEQSEAQPAATI